MKRVLLAVAALSTLAAAGAAAAQPYGGDGYRQDYNRDGYHDNDQGAWRGGYGSGYDRNQGQRLEWRIQRATQMGALSWREASYLRDQVNFVQRLEWRYSQDGLSRWEAIDLARRYDAISARIRQERSDGDSQPGQRYGQGYGYGWR